MDNNRQQIRTPSRRRRRRRRHSTAFIFVIILLCAILAVALTVFGIYMSGYRYQMFENEDGTFEKFYGQIDDTGAVVSGKIYFSNDSYSQRGSDITINRKPQPKASPAGDKFAPGDIVEHMSFGRGEVISVKPMGADVLYEIVFDRVGTKKLMATYARLKRAQN